MGDPRSYVSKNLMGCAGRMLGARGGGQGITFRASSPHLPPARAIAKGGLNCTDKELLTQVIVCWGHRIRGEVWRTCKVRHCCETSEKTVGLGAR